MSMSDLYYAAYNPDVLSCLANLSNDEVFTPPEIANDMLDMLPQELFSDPQATFLDPSTKSGVFLREIVKRLMIGLEQKIPDIQARLDHIMHEQVFGIAITEMTSLMSRRSVYCSKYPNSKYSISLFKDVQGNIRFRNTQHLWQNGKCAWCGASEKEYARDKGLETHAYEFIHTKKLEELFGMKFDVIISNPPYQLSDGGYGVSASPLYHRFVEQAKKLNPKYMTMIIPARWYSGGKGLDDFRRQMLSDNRIREIHDFPEASDCFQGVQIKGGICYFLWDRDNPGLCKVTTHHGNNIGTPEERPLLEEGCDVFIRYNIAVDILKKVQSKKEDSIEPFVSSQKPFGLRTYVHGSDKKNKNSLLLYENMGTSYIDRSEVTKSLDMIDKYKIFIPASGSGSDSFPHQILGKPIAGYPNEVCTETYCIIGPYPTDTVCKNVGE